MAKSSKSVRITLYTLLIITGILLHMMISGANVGAAIADIFNRPEGIFNFLGFVTKWTFSTFFSVQGVYLLGAAIIIEFVGAPLMQRFKVITFKTNFTMSVIGALYVLFFLRVLGVVLSV